ncbi:MAG: hypothetical protein HY670_01615 [Chloroflexi bacterium]|nr:hypothetical protein [Chloroflexota bacterium]
MTTTGTVEVVIDQSEVVRRLGYKGREPSSSSASLIRACIEKTSQLIHPAYIYELRMVERTTEQEAFLEGSLCFSSRIVSYVLSRCERAALFVATIGGALDEEMSRLLEKGQLLEATLLDAAGTEAVAQTLFRLRENINRLAIAEGCRATVQFSPGYCDWDLSQQKVLFQAVDGKALGIRLTDACWMMPRKSVSGVIGIGHLGPGTPPPCLAVCTKRESCHHKRVGWDPEKQPLL